MGKRKQPKDRVDHFFTLYNPTEIALDPATGIEALEQDVVFPMSTFARNIERWIADPALTPIVYPPFRGFELMSKTTTTTTTMDVIMTETRSTTGTGESATTSRTAATTTSTTGQSTTMVVERRLLPKGEWQPAVIERITWTLDDTLGTAQFTFRAVDRTPLPAPTYFQVSEFSLAYTTLPSAAAAPEITPTTRAEDLVPVGRTRLSWRALPISPEATELGHEPTRAKVWHTMLQRAYKWSVHDLLGGYTPVNKDVLVAKPAYSARYAHLKKKYAYLLTTWTEKTDPQKYVYEDVALASYLTLLWERHYSPSENADEATAQAAARTNVHFADLGAGNGLLTYLLHKEGYCGFGVDIRARKIWPRWQEEGASLVESTLDLPTYTLPPGVTWVLGNHADELCPWIASIATRGEGPRPNLFILPCCFYNQDGNLFAAPASTFPVPPHLEKAGSRYKRYLQYIGELCDRDGFDVTYDALRIPSTKNLALICTPKAGAAVGTPTAAVAADAPMTCPVEKQQELNGVAGPNGLITVSSVRPAPV
ncbi:tRNA methyltransferase 44 [Allomyces arbusculus]|nr:tRNA methyltransferase 44 [Allomyces arbusculus]